VAGSDGQRSGHDLCEGMSIVSMELGCCQPLSLNIHSGIFGFAFAREAISRASELNYSR
jgi:hypothetical protein